MTKDFIDIHFDRIKESRKSQYRLYGYSYKDIESPYDLLSILHYPSGWNSIDGRPVMTLKNGEDLPRRGGPISPMDTYEICKLYGCKHCAGQPIKTYEGKGR